MIAKVTMLRLAAAALFLGIIFYFFVLVRVILTPFFFGFLLAYALEPPVTFLEKRSLSRGASILVVYLLFTLIFAALLIYALPVLLKDLYRIIDLAPGYAKEVQTGLQRLELDYNSIIIPEGIRRLLDQTIQGIEAAVFALFQGAITAMTVLVAQTFNLILAPVLSFYLLLEYESLGKRLLAWVPMRYRREFRETGREINAVIRCFIRGNLVVALIVGVMATLGMIMIGMDFPVLIGIIVGVTNVIPYFGAFIAAVPACLLAFLKSKWLALYVLGLMVFIQQVEGNIIAPRVLSGCSGLHPLTIIFAVLAGGHLWGLAGMLLAVPVAGIIKVLLNHAYLKLI